MTGRGKTIYIILIAALALLGQQGPSNAGSAGEIDAGVNATLERLYWQIPGARELGTRAAGIMVFPTIVKAGMGIGADYGEGAMRSRGKTIGYYNTIAVSFGFQLGIQTRSVVIIFMTPEALSGFYRVDGFKIGVDGSVAIITIGAGGSIDTENITNPVVGFILGPTGLMYNLTLEGSHISRISR